MTIATKVFVALCHLHQREPNRNSFSTREVIAEVDRLPGDRPARQSLSAHLSEHVIANRKPTTSKLRYVYRADDGSVRLFNARTDPSHPDRDGQPDAPNPAKLDPAFAYLLDWYRTSYLAGRRSAAADPFVALRGVGKAEWRALNGVDFIERLRVDTEPPPDSQRASTTASVELRR